MSTYDDAFEMLIGIERGFTDDPKDKGNWTGGKIGVGELKGTKYGISAASYPQLDIRNLTLEQSKAIYYRDFWTPLWADKAHPQVAFELFEQAVNFSVREAVLHLQRGLNFFFDTKLIEDGQMGLATSAALAGATHRNLKGLLTSLNGEQYIHYRDLPPELRRRYGVGWLAQRVSLRK